MKQSMHVTIIKSLVKNENIKSLLLDHCENRYCDVTTDNENVYIEHRYSVGNLVIGNDYIINFCYHSTISCNLSINIKTVDNIRIASEILHKPDGKTTIISVINQMIKGYLLSQKRSIDHQLLVLEGW